MKGISEDTGTPPGDGDQGKSSLHGRVLQGYLSMREETFLVSNYIPNISFDATKTSSAALVHMRRHKAVTIHYGVSFFAERS